MSFPADAKELSNRLKRARQIAESERLPTKRPKSLFESLSQEDEEEPKSPIYLTVSSKPEDREAFFENSDSPIGFDSTTDVFLLDPRVRCDLPISDEQQVQKWFARSLCSFKNGTEVTKICGPWGEDNVLHEHYVHIKKKIYQANGELQFVAIELKGREYLLSRLFFDGWMDSVCMKVYIDFVK